MTGCTGDDDEPAAGSTPSPSATTPAPPTAPPAPPRPKRLECRRLSFDEALAPTDSDRIVSCKAPHTGQTYAVGQLRTVIDGHLVAVDSTRVQEQVARVCPRKLAAFLGTTDDVLRLAMLRSVWFTPSLEQSDAGANWFRCDAVAVAGDDRLARIRGSLQGRLPSPTGSKPTACAERRPRTTFVPPGAVPGVPHLASDPRGRPARQGLPG